MITITLQRNDSKAVSDSVSYTQNTITLNGQEFAFPKGADLLFQSPHEQIIDPKRDADGTLHATIIKQYNSADRKLFETCDENGKYAKCKADSQVRGRGKTTPVPAEIKVEEIIEKTLSELIAEKGNDIALLKDQYLDADIDDNEELKTDLKAQIQELKKEIALLKEQLNQK